MFTVVSPFVCHYVKFLNNLNLYRKRHFLKSFIHCYEFTGKGHIGKCLIVIQSLVSNFIKENLQNYSMQYLLEVYLLKKNMELRDFYICYVSLWVPGPTQLIFCWIQKWIQWCKWFQKGRPKSTLLYIIEHIEATRINQLNYPIYI